MSSLYPICMIRQWHHSLQMHINSFADGHRILYWQLDGSDIEKMMYLSESMVTLNEFTKEGVYWFWTIGPDGEESRRVRVYLQCETPDRIIDRILGYSKVEQKKRWASLVLLKLRQDFSAHPEIPLIQYLRNYMESTEDLQDYERDFYYELMFIAERYYNTMNIAMNASLGIYPVITYGGRFQLKTKERISGFRLYSVQPNNTLRYLPPVLKDDNDSKDTLSIPPNAGDLIQIIPQAEGAKNVWLNHFLHYQFDEKRTAELWQKAVDEKDQLEQQMLEDTELAFNSLELTEEDKGNWKLERAKTPYDFIVSRPIMDVTDRASFCSVQIPNWELLKATGQQFYLACRESDLLLRDDFDRLTPITSEEVIVDRISQYVEGNQYFYIQAQNGKIVSRLTRHDFLSDDPEDYREKNRALYFSLYEKRLRSALRYYLPEAETYIADLLSRFRSMPSVDIDEAYQYLLSEIPHSYEHRDDADKLMFVILEDWLSNFNVDTDFFEAWPKYYYSTDNLVFPPSKKNYLLCVGTMDFDSKEPTPKMSYYRSSPYQAIQLQVRSLKYYYLYAIDLESFHRSGFLYIDTYDHVDPIIYRSGINYERM